MKVVFRVDASCLIGSGHVMRCLTLAYGLRERGIDVLFVCREHVDNMCGFIEAKGFRVHRLPAPLLKCSGLDWNNHAPWLGVPWEVDAEETAEAFEGSSGKVDWLIVDHYAIGLDWESYLRPRVGKIMVIDDLADRGHDCDLLLDQNLFLGLEDRYDGLVPNDSYKLLGPKFALLRNAFFQERQALKCRSGDVRRILIFFGGNDPTSETEKVLEAILRLDLSRINFDVVVGKGNPRRDKIKSLCARLHRVNFYCQVDSMEKLMVKADLAIGAGGTTTWERCCLGLPALVVAVADNQVKLSSFGGKQGMFYYLGASDRVSVEKIESTLRFFCNAPELLQAFSERGRNVVDGKGVGRVINVMAPPDIRLRPAVLSDCDLVHAWRNDEETRRYIFDPAPIKLAGHRIWFKKSLEKPSRILLIGEMDGQPIGVLRYDLDGERAVISIYLVPGVKGQGIGTQLIRCGSVWVKNAFPDLRVVNAEALCENVASLRAFERAGYVPHHMTLREVLR